MELALEKLTLQAEKFVVIRLVESGTDQEPFLEPSEIYSPKIYSRQETIEIPLGNALATVKYLQMLIYLKRRTLRHTSRKFRDIK